MGSIPGLGRSPGEGNDNSLQHSWLENPHGQRSLVGYSPWGCKESDRTERARMHTALPTLRGRLHSIVHFLNTLDYCLQRDRQCLTTINYSRHLWLTLVSCFSVMSQNFRVLGPGPATRLDTRCLLSCRPGFPKMLLNFISLKYLFQGNALFYKILTAFKVIRLLLHTTWICSPPGSKVTLRTAAQGKAKCSVYCRHQAGA